MRCCLALCNLQVSKGFAVSIRSLWAQQSARQLLLRQLAAERSKGAHLGSSLEGKDARLHDLDATVRHSQIAKPSADWWQQRAAQRWPFDDGDASAGLTCAICVMYINICIRLRISTERIIAHLHV